MKIVYCIFGGGGPNPYLEGSNFQKKIYVKGSKNDLCVYWHLVPKASFLRFSAFFTHFFDQFLRVIWLWEAIDI